MLLRYFNPVGAHPSGRIGEAPNGIPHNLMPFITQTACGVRKELVVFGNDYPTPDGTCVRDYIHVMDLAEGHAAAIDYLMAHTGTEIFNLGTGQGYSVLDMVKAFEEVNHLTLPHRIGPRRPGDIATCYADPQKSRELLHWTAKRTLKELRFDDCSGYKVGDEIKVDQFAEGDRIDITGTSKGKGTQGPIARWNQHTGPMEHGSKYHRGVGSMSANSDPSRVFKNKHMAGHGGVERVTILNLEVVSVDAERNLLLVKGAVPGPNGTLLVVRDSVKA